LKIYFNITDTNCIPKSCTKANQGCELGIQRLQECDFFVECKEDRVVKQRKSEKSENQTEKINVR